MIATHSARFDAAPHMAAVSLHAAGIAADDTVITRRYLFSTAASAKPSSSACHSEIRVV